MTIKFKYGCDPELAVFDKKNSRYVSAHPFIPGTKAAPHKLDGGACQLDGVAAEFNTEPSDTPAEMRDKIIRVTDQMKKFLPADHEFHAIAAIEMDPAVWETVPEVHKELGCSPTFNIEKMEWLPAPVREAPNLVTFSGHIHIGWTDGMDVGDADHIEDCRKVHTVLSHCVDKITDPHLLRNREDADLGYQELLRRSLYGKKGEVRIKPYGVELRQPSAMWLRMTKGQYNSAMATFAEGLTNLVRYNVASPAPGWYPERILPHGKGFLA